MDGEIRILHNDFPDFKKITFHQIHDLENGFCFNRNFTELSTSQ